MPRALRMLHPGKQSERRMHVRTCILRLFFWYVRKTQPSAVQLSTAKNNERENENLKKEKNLRPL